MILVTLGTQDKPFNRLLEAIQKQIDLGVIKEKVIVQAGSTKFHSKNMEIFDLIPMDEFEKMIADCDLLITHGGVGSIIAGLNHNKKVIASARLKKYKEHINDHQLQIIDNFSKSGYILKLDDFDTLGELLKQVENFKPKKFESNAEKFCENIQNLIDSL